MKSKVSFVFVLGLALISSQAFSIPKTKKETKKLPPVVTSAEPSVARIKLNSQFGFNLLSGSAIVSGFQLGRLVSSGGDVYIGPEVNFMLFSSGSVINVLFGGWIENDWFHNPKKSIDLGLFAGAGFANKMPDWKTTNLIVLADISYTQEIDDSLSLRGQVRPGLFDKTLFGLILFNAQFRFP